MNALKLESLADRSDSKSFQYLIFGGDKATATTPIQSEGNAIECEAKKAFLELYSSNDSLLQEETIDALLTWIRLKACTDTGRANLNEGLLFALCGHGSFEGGMTDALGNAGIDKEQILLFPEGAVPLSEMTLFKPNRNRLLHE